MPVNREVPKWSGCEDEKHSPLCGSLTSRRHLCLAWPVWVGAIARVTFAEISIGCGRVASSRWLYALRLSGHSRTKLYANIGCAMRIEKV